MKVIEKAVFQMTDDPEVFELLEEDSYEYEGQISEMKGGGGGDTTQTTEPPASLRPAYNQYGQMVTDFMGDSGRMDKPFFPDQTYANMDPRTQSGLDAMYGSVNDPSSRLNEAQNYYSDVAGGKYLGLNPAFADAVMDPAIQQVNSLFGQAGRTGSSYNQNQAMEAGMRTLAPFYAQERQAMGQAAGMLPQLESQGYQRQLGAGDAYRNFDQLAINEAMARHDYDPSLAAMQQYGGLLAPGSNYNVTTTSGQSGSGMAGALGGALSGAAVGNTFGPWGAGVGAGIGLLGGLS